MTVKALIRRCGDDGSENRKRKGWRLGRTWVDVDESDDDLGEDEVDEAWIEVI